MAPWSRRWRALVAMLLLVPALFILSPTASLAATDAVADGDMMGLINAIAAANTGGSMTINLAPGGTYTLTTTNNSSTMGANGLPVILNGAAVTINGNGATLQRGTAAEAPNFRFFTVDHGASLQLTNLTLKRGLLATASSGNAAVGGAIFNSGTLSIRNCVFAANGTFGANGNAGRGGTNGTPGGDASGGAIANNGTAVIAGTTFDSNSATAGTGGSGNTGGGGGHATGGAIGNTGILTISNSTFTRNSAVGGVGGDSTGNGAGANGGDAIGGAVSAVDGTVTLTNATFTGNTTRAGDEGTGSPDGAKGTGTGGAIGRAAGFFTVTTTILDRNTAGNSQSSPYNNCTGLAASNDGGRNLEYVPPTNPPVPPSCAFSASSPTYDIFADPNLGAIASFGGPTPTVPLQTGSAAIDAGGASCPSGITADQRGQPRPQGAACDIGAFEYVPTGNPMLKPASGPASGGPVSLTGTFLQIGTVITIDGALAPVISVSGDGTALVANVPAHVGGAVAAVATNPGNLIGPTTTFTYLVPITITSISPASGSATGGTAVVITGGEFATPAIVTLGGNACRSVSVIDSGTITCVTPAGTGVVDLVVVTANQTATLRHVFSYGVVSVLPVPRSAGALPSAVPVPLPAMRQSPHADGALPPPSPLPSSR